MAFMRMRPMGSGVEMVPLAGRSDGLINIMRFAIGAGTTFNVDTDMAHATYCAAIVGVDPDGAVNARKMIMDKDADGAWHIRAVFSAGTGTDALVDVLFMERGMGDDDF